MVTKWLKILLCRIFAQCYDDLITSENQQLALRVSHIERELSRERRFRARDTFGV